MCCSRKRSQASNPLGKKSVTCTYICCCVLIAVLMTISYFGIHTSKLGIVLNQMRGMYKPRMSNQESHYCAKYLQQNIIGNLVLKTKKEFDEKLINEKNFNGSKFNTGFSTLSSHNCPVIRPKYICSDFHDNRFENYTISLEYDNGTQFNNYSIYNKYFSSNIENKFMKRLFKTGALFDTNKDMTIIFWGNSYMRQVMESISCMLYQFDFTPLKFWKYSSDKNKLKYKENGYINKHNYTADIRMENFKHQSYFRPCLYSQRYWPRKLFSKFNVSNMESWLDNYTDWDKIYGQFYINQLKNGHNDKNVKDFFVSFSESDLQHLGEYFDMEMNGYNYNNNEKEEYEDDDLWHQVSKNIVDMYHDCSDTYTYISLFNNKTQKKNDIFLITSNADNKDHSLIDSLKKLNFNHLKKWKKLNFEQFVNQIDVIVLNFGNDYEKHDRHIAKYNLDKLKIEYAQLQHILRSQKHNYDDIPIIIANPFDSNYMNQSEWKKFENSFINKYKLPIVHYSLSDVITKSSMTYKQLKRQRSEGKHYCEPGAAIDYAFTFFEMIEMLTMQIQL